MYFLVILSSFVIFTFGHDKDWTQVVNTKNSFWKDFGLNSQVQKLVLGKWVIALDYLMMIEIKW